MKKICLLVILLVVTFSTIFSQTEKHCGSDEINLELLQSHPELLNNWTRNYISQESFITHFEQNIATNRSDTIFKIPVVVHVIHFDGTENISDLQIKNGIDILNRNYRKQNPDTIQIVSPFQPLAADMGIEFELAKLDPDGNCTNGINRVRSTLTTTGGHNVKDLIHWPREKYLNIYIVRNAAGLAGHALMPFQADSLPGWDGIVLSGDYMGNIGTSNDLKSVVLSHEVGHYLNLYHIWGGNNVPGFYYLPCGDAGNCAYDDGVFDTPNTLGWSTCNLNGNTCDTALDNVQNFMDYAYCARMFTYGQRTRARAALHSPLSGRNNLWVPANLAATGIGAASTLCAVNFTTGKYTYCPGDSAVFYDASYNGATQWLWDFGDGGTSTVQNPKHAYSNPGIYTVTLTAGNGTNTITHTRNNAVYIVEPTSLFFPPYTEGFEYSDSLTQTGMVGFTEEDEIWEIVNGIGATGNKCVKALSENDTLRYKYTLITPTLDLSNMASPRFDFKYAFAQKDSINTDQMFIRISKNCGATWATLNTQTTTLPTHPGFVNGNYIPQTADWRQMSITNISGSYQVNNVLIKIEFISGGGNDLFIDDINIYDANAIGIEENPTAYFNVYPNPASEFIEIKGDFETAGFELYNTQGQLLLNRSIYNNEKISLGNFAPGIYYVVCKYNDRISNRKLIINR